MQITAAELSALIQGTVEGSADTVVTGFATVDEARPGDLVLAEGERYFRKAINSDAAVVLTSVNLACDSGKCVIRVEDAGASFIELLQHFDGSPARPAPGIGPGAVVEQGATLGRNVSIGPNCCVRSGASIGDGCVLIANVHVGSGVAIGDECTLHPGVTVYPGCTIGSRVTLHAGVVIGADGFGYRPGPKGLVKFPHLGTVEIGDDVEIGANSAVDRAKTGATIIGKGTKIDNLVHIAHNVKIGANCVIVALSGVAGSVEVGNGVTLAAQTGVKDHVRIGDGCVVAARAGVIGDLADGAVVSGFPARDHVAEKRIEAARLHLPDMLRRLRALEREMEDLRSRGEEREDDNTHD